MLFALSMDIYSLLMCVAKLTDTTFVSGSADRTLKLWNIENNDSVRTFQGHTNGVNDSVRTFQGHTNGVQCVAKLTDTTFVSGSKDNTLKLWNIVNNHAIRTYEGHKLRIVLCREIDRHYVCKRTEVQMRR